MENEKKIGKKTLLAWVKEIFSQNEATLADVPPRPPEETVERLIGKATGDSSNSSGNDNNDGDGGNDGDTPESTQNRQPETQSCAYAVKRNIVESIQEIRRFAEKHHLAATIVRALLTLLAEMAIGAMKGKVGEKALETLLKAFNYQQHIEEAYIRGKNETIVREYFPESEEIPHLGGMQRETPVADNIFSVAKQA